MFEYVITRLSDKATYKLRCRSTKRAEKIIGAFIRESEIKSMWRSNMSLTHPGLKQILIPQPITPQ